MELLVSKVQGPIGSTGGPTWLKRRQMYSRFCGVKGESGIQGDNSDGLSVLVEHLPIQVATRYGKRMCFIKCHVSEDRLSIIELAGGVGTLPNVSAYYEPAWYFDAKFVNDQ